MAESVNFETTTFKVLYTCIALLVLKVFSMILLTGRLRFLKRVVMNPEDCILLKGLKVKYNDPDVERVRRAHLNDLENIPLFISAAFLYTAMKPNPIIAIPLIISYTIARYAHTFVYVATIKQPARFITFSTGLLITAYMAGYVALSLKDY